MNNERLPRKNRDKETRLFQKTRKTTPNMGGLPEDRPDIGICRRKVQIKCQQGAMEENKPTPGKQGEEQDMDMFFISTLLTEYLINSKIGEY